LKQFKNGNEIPLPTTNEVQVSDDDESTFWTLPVIIGIAVGGGVVLLLLISLIIYFIVRNVRSRRREKENHNLEAQEPVSAVPTATISLRTQYSKSADPCEILVNSGYETPTTPKPRNFFH